MSRAPHNVQVKQLEAGKAELNRLLSAEYSKNNSMADLSTQLHHRQSEIVHLQAKLTEAESKNCQVCAAVVEAAVFWYSDDRALSGHAISVAITRGVRKYWIPCGGLGKPLPFMKLLPGV